MTFSIIDITVNYRKYVSLSILKVVQTINTLKDIEISAINFLF